MKTKIRIEKPELVDVTVSITMSLVEWERLSSQLTETTKSPSWEIRGVISSLVKKAKSEFSEESEG